MWTLFITVTFVPFLWGDSNVTVKAVEGFKSQNLCVAEGTKFKNQRFEEGKLIYSYTCVGVSSEKD